MSQHQPRQPEGTPTGGRYATPMRGEVAIGLEDLARCGPCAGTGGLSGRTCPACVGTGVLDEDGWTRHADLESRASVACGGCEGGITADLAICATCDGAGVVRDYSLVG